MDNISFINKDEVNEKINMIMRQTDYDYDTGYSKLTDAHYDHIKVIKAYLGITEKKALSSLSSFYQFIILMFKM